MHARRPPPSRDRQLAETRPVCYLPVMLDATAQDYWTRHGWVWLRGFLGEDERRALLRWTDEIAAWPEVPGTWMRYYEKCPDQPSGRMLARIENFVPYHAGLAGLFASPRLMELLQACAG